MNFLTILQKYLLISNLDGIRWINCGRLVRARPLTWLRTLLSVYCGGFSVMKVQCGSFLNITLSLSNYSVIPVHLLRENGATAERFAVSASHSYSIVNTTVCTNYHHIPYKPCLWVGY